MVLGQPQFLPFLALALLPLLIHLLARRQRRVVPFSMTKFLREVAQQTQGRRWLRELLLLLLRTGAVFFALMALVRPYASVPLPLPPAPTAFALVIDNSLSMQSRSPLRLQSHETWFDRSLKSCERVLKEVGAEVVLLAADNPSEPVCDFTSEPSRSLNALRQIRPTFRALDLSPALQTADSLLAQHPAAVKRILVFTDLQSEPFRSLALPSLKNQLVIVDAKPNEPVGNARLVAKLRLPLDPNTDGSAVTELKNMSNLPLNGSVVALVAKKSFARLKVSLAPKEQKTVILPLPFWVLDAADRQGLVEIEIRWESELDTFAWDDFVKFAFKSPKNLVVTNAVREGRQFVDTVLKVTDITHHESRITPDADAIIASAPTDSEMARQLVDWLRQGKKALVVADNLNSPIWSMFNISVKPSKSGQKRRVQWVDEGHPILQGLGNSLHSVTAQPFVEVSGSSFKALATLDDGTAFLAELSVGAGQCLLLTVPLNPQRSDLVYSPVFVPLVHRFVRFASYGHELSPQERETKPQASLGKSTVVPESESNFFLPPQNEFAIRLRKFGATLVTADQLPAALLSETKLRDLTSLCLALSLLCLLTESIFTLILWKRAR
ncbi:MAG: VWA domain-containing protein [Armatimonadetes bacterium]|nr:VWA domain-containing protein [Armatimonadota bacterium]